MKWFRETIALFCFATSLFGQDTLNGTSKDSLTVAADQSQRSHRRQAKLRFKVTSLSGTVQYQPPLAAEWRKARKGEILEGNILLQVSKNSTISMDSEDSLGREGLPIKKSRITISAPTIVRLSRDSFRKVQVTQQMIKAIPDMASLKMMEGLIQKMRSMKEAWKQDASMLMGKDWIDKNTLKMLAEAFKSTAVKEPVSITASVGKINLTNPQDKQISLAKSLPTEINLKWGRSDAPSPDISSYTVYFWKKGDPMLPFAKTKGDQYLVRVQSAGTYFAQISSVDGGYRSEIKSIKIELEKDSKKNKDDGSESGGPGDPLGEVAKSRIKALMPDKNLVWYGRGNWPLMHFEWTKAAKCSQNARFKFDVLDKKSKSVYSVETNKTYLNWQPDSSLKGDFLWHVQVKICVGDNKKLIALSTSTTPRKLSLVHPNNQGSIIGQIAAPKFRGTIVLDEF